MKNVVQFGERQLGICAWCHTYKNVVDFKIDGKPICGACARKDPKLFALVFDQFAAAIGEADVVQFDGCTIDIKQLTELARAGLLHTEESQAKLRQGRLENWLEGRPEIIKTLARKYPPGTKLMLHGKLMHVISFSEEGHIGVSAIDPSEDYEGAVAKREQVCPCCVDQLDLFRV